MSTVDHPHHYSKFRREVIDLVKNMDFCTGNALKHLLRAPFKGRCLEDLRKAMWYITHLDVEHYIGEEHYLFLTVPERNLAKLFSEDMMAYDKDIATVVSMFATNESVETIASALRQIVKERSEDGQQP